MRAVVVLYNRLLPYVLCAAALALLAGGAGCSISGRKSQTNSAPVAAGEAPAHPTEPAQPSPLMPALDMTGSSAKAPAVNLFGEFDGIERIAPPAVGEAGFQQHSFLEEGYDSGIAVDPTGKWMVYASTRHSEHPHIYLQRVDGTSVTQLTNDTADDAYPAFSPDGKRIAFSSTRSGSWDIYAMDIDGRNMVQVTSGPMQDLHPSFSPDGTRLVYCSLGSRSNQWELWVVNLVSGERKMIGHGLFPAWSPSKDVERIAFQRARARGSRWFSLWTLDLVNGEARQVTEVAVSSNAAIVCPSWSPDGQYLVFQTVVEPSLAVGGKPRGQQDIWTMKADGSNRQRLTDGSGSNLMPYWAVDNRVYFISDRGGTECVWSAQADVGPAMLPVAGDKARPQATPSGAIGSTDASEVAH